MKTLDIEGVLEAKSPINSSYTLSSNEGQPFSSHQCYRVQDGGYKKHTKLRFMYVIVVESEEITQRHRFDVG
jgi:hypothetical protein